MVYVDSDDSLAEFKQKAGREQIWPRNVLTAGGIGLRSSNPVLYFANDVTLICAVEAAGDGEVVKWANDMQIADRVGFICDKELAELRSGS